MSSQNRGFLTNSQILLSSLFISFSGFVLLSHQTGTIFPWGPAFLFIAAGVIAVSRAPNIIRISGMITASCSYLIWIFFFAAPSLLNMDPDKVAVSVLRIQKLSSLDGISGYAFYQRVPVFFIFSSVSGIQLGIDGPDAIKLVGVMAPLFTGISAAVLARRFQPGSEILATIAATVSTSILYFGQAPYPQLFAVCLWGLLLFTIYQSQNTSDTNYTRLSLLFGGVLFLTHKLALIIPAIALIVASMIMFLGRSMNGVNSPRPLHRLWILFGIGSLLQYFYLSGFGRSIFSEKIPSLLDPSVAAAPSSDLFLAASPPVSNSVGILIRNGDWLVFGALAGVCYIALIIRYRHRLSAYATIFGSAAATGSFLPIVYFAPDSAGILRIMMFATVPFAVIIGVALTTLYNSQVPVARSVVRGLLMFFVLSQVAVTGAVPDHPTEPREYLTTTEVDGKQWSNAYVQDIVYADFFYAREIIDFNASGQTYRTGQTAVAEGYGMITTAYLDGSVLEQDYNYILYRPDYNIYQTAGRWRLTWDPEGTFNANRSRIFDNGGATLYHKS